MPTAKGVPRIYFEALLVTVLVATFARTFLVQGVHISSGSMENGLLVGDHLLVNRFLFHDASEPASRFLPRRRIRRGEVIVHRYPPDPSTVLVKRCMGLPGERVEIVAGRLLVDGREVDESAYITPAKRPRSMPAQVLGPDRYFVMGDQRGDSLDSRDWGAVPGDLVVGKPLFVYWSWRDPDRVLHGLGARLAWLASHFFDRTRWSRTGHRVR